MQKLLPIISYFICFMTSCKTPTLSRSMIEITGEYISDDSKPEKASILILLNDSTFIYRYMLVSSQSNSRIEFFQLDPSILGGKPPINNCFLAVPV